MQLRYETGLTSEEYVKTEAWRDARLERCPNHPHGGCSVASHGTYERKTPPGARVPRWYCRESHTTIGLLADCLAARLPGTLDALEAVVVVAEEAGSLEEAADEEIASRVGLTAPQIEDMYRLMALARYEDRFVIPTTHRETAEDAYDLQGSCGFSFGNESSTGSSRPNLFGGSRGRSVTVRTPTEFIR